MKVGRDRVDFFASMLEEGTDPDQRLVHVGGRLKAVPSSLSSSIF